VLGASCRRWTPAHTTSPRRELLRLKLRLEYRLGVSTAWVAECGGMQGWQAFKALHVMDGLLKLRAQASGCRGCC
jgi:hypothetical protein